MLKIVEKLQRLHITNQIVYNILLEQYGSQFYNTYNELRI